jgi:hypothetical protein
MSKVVAFKGSIIPGEANPDIIEELERLLTEARSGELEAFAYCTVVGDAKGTGWTGNAGKSDALAAAIGMLSWRYIAEAMTGADE